MATVSVYLVALTVTTTPVALSLGEPELVVYVPQLFGATRPSSLMTRLLAVNLTQLASPFERGDVRVGDVVGDDRSRHSIRRSANARCH